MPRPTDSYYTPPDFAAYEFDDQRITPDQVGSATRWLSGFQGRIGDPASALQLSWRASGGRQVSICTRRANPKDAFHRLDAIFEITTAQFYDPGPPARPVATGWDDVQRYVDDSERWHEGEVVVDQRTLRAELSEVAECRFGYAAIDDVVVCFVHRGLGVERLALRRLPLPADDYRIDPAAPQPVAELEQEWEEFFRDRPDLDH